MGTVRPTSCPKIWTKLGHTNRHDKARGGFDRNPWPEGKQISPISAEFSPIGAQNGLKLARFHLTSRTRSARRRPNGRDVGRPNQKDSTPQQTRRERARRTCMQDKKTTHILGSAWRAVSAGRLDRPRPANPIDTPTTPKRGRQEDRGGGTKAVTLSWHQARRARKGDAACKTMGAQARHRTPASPPLKRGHARGVPAPGACATCAAALGWGTFLKQNERFENSHSRFENGLDLF